MLVGDGPYHIIDFDGPATIEHLTVNPKTGLHPKMKPLLTSAAGGIPWQESHKNF
jgi:hypothetical protein